MNRKTQFGFNSSGNSELPKPTFFGGPQATAFPNNSTFGQSPNLFGQNQNMSVKRSLSRQEAVSAKKNTLLGQTTVTQSGQHSVFGQPQPGFTSSQNQFAGGFGQSQQTGNSFGQNKVIPPQTSRFGPTHNTASAPQTNLFRHTPNYSVSPQTNLFGKTQPGNITGQSSQFGEANNTNAAPQTNLFGQLQRTNTLQQGQTNATFGQPQTSTTLFGQTQNRQINTFEQPQPVKPQQNPTVNFFGQPGNKPTNQPQASNLFQQPTNTNFGRPSITQMSQNKGLFGSTSGTLENPPVTKTLFGKTKEPAAPKAASLFGHKPVDPINSQDIQQGLISNTVTTTSSNLFAKSTSDPRQTKSSAGMFGQSQSLADSKRSVSGLFGKNFATTKQSSKDLFGQTSKTGPTQNSGLFGQQNVDVKPNTPQIGVFNKPTTGLFGTNTKLMVTKPNNTPPGQNIDSSLKDKAIQQHKISQSNLSRKRSLDSEEISASPAADEALFEGKKPLKRIAHQPTTTTGLFKGVLSTSPKNSVSQNVVDPRIKRRLGSAVGRVGIARRQLSSGASDAAAISTSNSLVCTTVPNDYNTKEHLKKHFLKYGRVVRISNNLKNKSATIRFFSHEEALKAKMNGRNLCGRQIHIYFSKPKRQSTDKVEEVMENTDQTEFKQEKSDKPQQRSHLFKTPFGQSQVSTEIAKSDSEKLAVLEKVEKLLRSRTVKQSDLSKAKVMKGTCPDMCPEKERYLRQHRNLLHFYELDANKVLDHKLVVKEYSRSSADQEEPLPHEIRPSSVLRVTMDFLLTTVLKNIDHERIADWYDFVWNRTRAIRKEISIQQLNDPVAVQVAEECARFHISCAHELCEEDRMNFDPKINNENLEKTMKTVLDIYSDVKIQFGNDTQQVNEAEFQSYHILLNINRSADVLRELQNMTSEVRATKDVQLAVIAFSSLHSNNYSRFFNAVKHATYLQACIMHRYFEQVRKHAISTMARAYSTSKSNTVLPIEKVCSTLHFNDENQFHDFCSEHMIIIKEGNVELMKNESYEPEETPSLFQSNLISNKIHGHALGEVIAHGRLPSSEVHEPTSSFDSSGKYIGPHLSLAEHRVSKQEPSTSVQQVEQFQSTGVPNTEVKLIAKELFVEVIDEMVLELANEMMLATKLVINSNKIFNDVLKESTTKQVKEISLEVLLEEKQRLIEIKQQKLLEEKQKREAQELLEKRQMEKKKKEKEKEQSTLKVAEEINNEVVKELVLSTLKQEYRKAKIVYHSNQLCEEILNNDIDVMLKNIVSNAVKQERKIVHMQKYKLIQSLRLSNYLNKWKKVLAKLQRDRHARQTFLSGPIKRDINTQVNELIGCEVNNLKIKGRQSFPLDAQNRSRLSMESLSRLHQMHQTSNNALEEKVNIVLKVQRSAYFDPLSITQIIHENIQKTHGNILWKLIVASTNKESQCCSWLRCKLGIDEKEKISSLDYVVHSKTFQSATELNKTRNVSVCYKMLGKNVDRINTFGSSAIIFTFEKGDNISERKEDLRTLLKSKPMLPKIPILAVKYATEEHELDFVELRLENLISDVHVISLEKKNDHVNNSNKLQLGLSWLAQNTCSVNLQTSTLRDLLEEKISDHYIVKLCRHSSLRKKLNFPTLDPQSVIEIYNELIDQVIGGLTSSNYKQISWPAKEFVKDDLLLPNRDWNSDKNLSDIQFCLENVKLPTFPLLNIHETPNEVHQKVLNYCQQVCPFKPSLFSHINVQLTLTINRYQDDINLMTNTENELTLVEWLPWQQIIDAVASSRFEDVIYSKQGDIITCYDPSLININLSENYTSMFEEIEIKAQNQDEKFQDCDRRETDHSLLEGASANLETMIINMTDMTDFENTWIQDFDIVKTTTRGLTNLQDDIKNERVESQRFEKWLQELLL